MGNIFKPDSPVMIALTRIADLMILNFLWLIGCIPVITIGTSTVALYYCIEQLRENGEIAIWGSFWKAYRSNFKQATVLLIIMCIVIAIFYTDFVVIWGTSQTGSLLIKIIVGTISFFAILAMGYIFPLQSKFNNTVKETIKNACILSILHTPKSVIVAVVNLLPVVLFLCFPAAFFCYFAFCLVLGVAVSSYIKNAVLQKVFRKYYK